MRQRKRLPYDTDLNDGEWEILEPLLPPPKKEGRPREVSLREVIDAIFYVLRSGCAWRLMPHDFPPWKLVYWYFKHWQKAGAWQSAHDALREKVRVKAGKNPKPSAGILDSQSVKTTKKKEFVAMTLARK